MNGRRMDPPGAELILKELKVSDIYTGQVERDPDGTLWAVLYRGEVTRADAIVSQEPTRSVRRGRKRVEEMILSQADADQQLTSSGEAPARGTGRRIRYTLGLFARRPWPTES